MVSIICVNTPVGGLRARTTGTTGNTVAGLHLFHPLLLGRYSHITCSTESTVALLSHQLTLSARTGRTDNTAQQQQYSLQELSKIRLKVRGCDLHFLWNKNSILFKRYSMKTELGFCFKVLKTSEKEL